MINFKQNVPDDLQNFVKIFMGKEDLDLKEQIPQTIDTVQIITSKFKEVINYKDSINFDSTKFKASDLLKRVEKLEVKENDKKAIYEILIKTIFDLSCPESSQKDVDSEINKIFQTEEKSTDIALNLGYACQLLSLVPKEFRNTECIKNCMTICKDVKNEAHFNSIHNVFYGVAAEQRADTIRDATVLIKNFDKVNDRVSVLAALSVVPNKEKAPLLKDAIALFNEDYGRHERTVIIQALTEIPTDERADVIKSTLSFFEKDDTGFDRALILRTLAKIPQGERTSIFEDAKPFWTIISTENARTMEVIASIPKEQRQGILDVTASLVKKGDVDIAAILLVLKDTSESQRTNLIKDGRTIFTESDDATVIALALGFLNEIPEDKRANLIKDGRAIFTESDKASIKAAALSLLNKIPEDKRAKVIEYGRPLFRENDDGLGRIRILEAIAEIPDEQRANVIRHASNLFKKENKSMTQAGILMGIAQIPESQREIVSKEALPLLRYDDDPVNCRAVLEVLADIPSEQRTHVIKDAVALIQDDDWARDRLAILKVLSKIPEKQRTNIIKSSTDFFIEEDKGENRAKILQAMAEIPEELRAGVIKDADFLKQIKSVDERSEIMKAISVISEEQREYLKIIFAQEEEIRPHLIPITLAYSQIPQKDRTIETLKSFINLYKNISEEQQEELSWALKVIAPQHKILFLAKLASNKDLLFGNLISNIFKENEKIQIDTYNYLSESLDSFTDRQKGLELAENVIDLIKKLNLPEEETLCQKALQIMASVSPEALKNRKNRYRLYQDLKQTLETESLLKLAPKPFVIDEGKYTFNLDTFRERATHKKLTFGDLPKLESDCLEKIFDSIQKRFSESEFKEVDKAIQDNYARSFQELRQNITSEASLISNYLKMKAPDNTPVQKSMVYLYSIISMLLDQDKTPSLKPPFLSPQEEMLLAVSTSITNCTTGQRDGIDNYYIHGNLQDKYKLLKGEQTLLEKVNGSIDESVQKALNVVLASRGLFTELTGKNESDQESHQTLYLKNRYHKQIGFDHTLTFDFYSTEIEDVLMDKKPEEVVDAVFSRLPKELLSQTKNSIAASMENKNLSYGNLMEYFESTIPKELKKSGWQRDYLQFKSDNDEEDDYYVCTGVTEKGALSMLSTSGYLISIK